MCSFLLTVVEGDEREREFTNSLFFFYGKVTSAVDVCLKIYQNTACWSSEEAETLTYFLKNHELLYIVKC